MIAGVGIDVIEIDRLAAALERHGEHFEARVFTPAEREACRGRGDRLQALAARFAAKEACFKALGTGWTGGIGFRDVEIAREDGKAPELTLHGEALRCAERLGVTRCLVSLTHQPGIAAAVVILER